MMFRLSNKRWRVQLHINVSITLPHPVGGVFLRMYVGIWLLIGYQTPISAVIGWSGTRGWIYQEWSTRQQQLLLRR